MTFYISPNFTRGFLKRQFYLWLPLGSEFFSTRNLNYQWEVLSAHVWKYIHDQGGLLGIYVSFHPWFKNVFPDPFQ